MVDFADLKGVLAPVNLDGAALHRQVPPQRWCVTRADLLQFRHILQDLVAEGKVTPTKLDSFDVSDSTVGPSIYTANNQLIRPLTDRAGKPSWALMLHPEGLECDMFVTHCWQEGTYEFIDKVLNSWPRGSRHAYCCMLSNPQNLDIGDLIGSPRDSPFAKALHQSTHMLVVPNRSCSIYSRIWCAYEAYVAYSDSKIIFTASAPVPNLARNVLIVFLLEFVVVVACCIWSLQFQIRQWGKRGGYANEASHHLERGSSAIAVVLLFFSASIQPGVVAHVLTGIASILSATFLGLQIRLAAVLCARNGFFGYGTSMQLLDTMIGCALCIAAILSEVDVLFGIAYNREAEQLRNSYTGKLQDAQSSKPEDKESIQAEISASGLADAVDDAIQILLDAGMSTPTLQLAVSRAGSLHRASHVPWMLICIAWSFWIFASLDRIFTICELHWLHTVVHEDCLTCVFGEDRDKAFCARIISRCTHPLEVPVVWIFSFGVLAAVVWLVLFANLSLDKRGFAAKALGRGWLLGFVPYTIANLAGVTTEEAPVAMPFFLMLSVTVVLLTAAGPGRIACLPIIGPPLVRILLAPFSFQGCKCKDSSQAEPQKKTAAELQEETVAKPKKETAAEPKKDIAGELKRETEPGQVISIYVSMSM
eukprot:TRINITY_DN23819_c0_g1_i1.p1 TRINITY_DN23819_c0_g1~~TRINITY_DN23819_c0_g1_i1.p1  ORF type:complete len:649 (+),score=58.23 TRINITY_DN23819_c0_g1_i1:72-2018(+)